MQCGTLRTKRSRAAMKMLLLPDRIKALKLTNCRRTLGGGGTRTDRRIGALQLKLYTRCSHQFNSGFFLVNNLGKSGSQGPHLPPVYIYITVSNNLIRKSSFLPLFIIGTTWKNFLRLLFRYFCLSYKQSNVNRLKFTPRQNDAYCPLLLNSNNFSIFLQNIGVP